METRWYLWAVNDDPMTNQYLVRVVGEQNPENVYEDKLCADGKKRNLFLCPKGYANVLSALSAISEFNLKLEVFKESTEDSISRFDLWKKSVRKAKRKAMYHRHI